MGSQSTGAIHPNKKRFTVNERANDLKEVDRNKIGDKDSLVIPR